MSITHDIGEIYQIKIKDIIEGQKLEKHHYKENIKNPETLAKIKLETHNMSMKM
jgi:hypothetical protein